MESSELRALEFQVAIRNFLTNFENEKNIHLVFVCETDSRPCGVDVVDSDFDLKGFYLPHPSDSLKIIPKIQSAYKLPHNKLLINNMECDLDIEFLDIRQFGIEKIRDHIIYLDYVLYSPTIYINRYPQLIEEIKARLEPYPDEFLFKLNNLHEFCLKSLNKSGECWVKKLLSALICGVQYLYVLIYDKFPNYNIWALINEFRTRFTELEEKQLISKNDISLFENIFDMIEFYYEEKKNKGRKFGTNFISTYQFKFVELLKTKFPRKKKKNLHLNFDLEFFENISNIILKSWLNLCLPGLN
jgi:hypothetical protein